MPSNDQEISELVSKSLRYKLTNEESSKLNKSVDNNAQTREFLELSTRIQKSVAGVTARIEDGDESVAPPLSDDARDRLRSSIRKAVSESGTHSPENAGQEKTLVNPSLARMQEFDEAETRKMLSRFTIIRKLGDGGLGTVWLARDERLNRNVAIKEMNQQAAESPAAWSRFHREAEITGHLEHPNVISLYQFGSDPQTAQPFYAMRFVGKRTLADAILELHERRIAGEDISLHVHRLLADFLRICQAIAYAHSRGVIHRDLKPENVAIDNYGQVIVLDWGLAKILDTAELSTKSLSGSSMADSALAQTMAGEVIGTPLYMAPEQAAGDLDSIDERTDIYGLGAILFSILTGKAPHERSSISQAGTLTVDQVLERIASSETPSPRDYIACVPRDLEQICLKAMARRRFARFDSAIALSNAVELWMAGQSEKATRYETLRMEGRELRANFQAVVDDLESNARFMARLPPIQELIHVSDDEQDGIWRERLAQIFTGLLGAKSQFERVVYSRVDDGKFSEIVRVERHSRDRGTVRKVPRSRLQTDVACSDYINAILENPPDEVLTSLVCDPMCCQDATSEPSLVAGLPVYDEQSEEVFGMIMLQCRLSEIVKEMKDRSAAGEVVAACDTHQVMMQFIDGKLVESVRDKPASEVAPHFEPAIAALQTQNEFIDDTNHDIYGARLWLIPNKHGIMFLLKMSNGSRA